MPQILPTLAQISRQKKSAALMVLFHDWQEFSPQKLSGRLHGERLSLLNFLESNDISFYEAYPPLLKGTIAIPYVGSLYVDLEMDESCSRYKLLCQHLETDDGSLKIEGVKFIYITPELADKFQ